MKVWAATHPTPLNARLVAWHPTGSFHPFLGTETTTFFFALSAAKLATNAAGFMDMDGVELWPVVLSGVTG